jgi:hypothetical protein
MINKFYRKISAHLHQTGLGHVLLDQTILELFGWRYVFFVLVVFALLRANFLFERLRYNSQSLGLLSIDKTNATLNECRVRFTSDVALARFGSLCELAHLRILFGREERKHNHLSKIYISRTQLNTLGKPFWLACMMKSFTRNFVQISGPDVRESWLITEIKS